MQLKQIFLTKVFLLGFIIRLILMPFSGHYDIRGINFAVHNLPFNKELNVYDVACCKDIDYLVKVNFGRDYFIYPPLTYFTLGTFMWILKPLYGNEFVTWINGFGNDVLSVLTHPYVFRYMFFMKLPYLIFDILLVVILREFFVKRGDKHRVMKYWWLNPIVIFLPYVWGQFDIIPTAFTVLGVLAATKNRSVTAAVLFGIAASFKNYPLMLLPLIAVVLGKNLAGMFRTFFLGLAPFIFTTLPYWGHEFFRKTVLFSWQSQKMLDFLWAIGGDDGIYPFVIGYFLIFLWTLYSLRGQNQLLPLPIVSVLMWYYATTNFHQQWFLWVLPFLTLYAVSDKRIRLIGIWVIALFFLRLLEIQANVTTEMFVWLAPAVEDLPKSRAILGSLYDIHKLRNLVNSAFMATAVFLIHYTWTARHKKV